MLHAIASLNVHGVPYTIENPARRHQWWIPEVHQLLEGKAHDFFYDICMHGGKRIKHQRLRGTLEASSLELHCDGAHPHLPWRKGVVLFSADEAEYPALFCERVAQAIANHPTVKLRASRLVNSSDAQ